MIEINNTKVWLDWLYELTREGKLHEPRGFKCYAIYDKQLVFNPLRPMIMPVGRKLSYRFMFAEAFWILAGDNQVDGIAPFNKNISQFSDDGKIFFGAYGPKIVEQLPYVIDNLTNDRDSRQAVLTIWRESPPKTKDVPCTIMVKFHLDGRKKLHCHVVMRSSDVWLGLPYDIFNFSMLMHRVSTALPDQPKPTTLTYTLMNGHLYERNWQAAIELLANFYQTAPTPDIWDGVLGQPEVSFNTVHDLMWRLAKCRDAEKPRDTWLNYKP